MCALKINMHLCIFQWIRCLYYVLFPDDNFKLRKNLVSMGIAPLSPIQSFPIYAIFSSFIIDHQIFSYLQGKYIYLCSKKMDFAV